MAKTKQFTITISNQPGAAARVARALSDAKVNLVAILGVAQGDSGTLHVVVDSAARARKALQGARVAFQELAAEQHEIPNKPGALADFLEKLASKGVNLSAVYATAAGNSKKATVVCSAATIAAEETKAATSAA
jgi:hypothetical protein